MAYGEKSVDSSDMIQWKGFTKPSIRMMCCVWGQEKLWLTPSALSTSLILCHRLFGLVISQRLIGFLPKVWRRCSILHEVFYKAFLALFWFGTSHENGMQGFFIISEEQRGSLGFVLFILFSTSFG